MYKTPQVLQSTPVQINITVGNRGSYEVLDKVIDTQFAKTPKASINTRLLSPKIKTLEDLDSKRVKIKTMPKTVSSTYNGQVLIKQVFEKVPFTNKPILSPKTMREFNLQDDKSINKNQHQNDHIQQNI